jgi:diguanylate cyclase (GGDEF)-like protein
LLAISKIFQAEVVRLDSGVLLLGLKTAGVCVFETDLLRRKCISFENAEGIFGVSGAELLEGMKSYQQLSPEAYRAALFHRLVHAEDIPLVEEAFRLALTGSRAGCEFRALRADDRCVWCKLDLQPMPEGQPPERLVGAATDISAAHTRIDSLRHEAHRDGPTGLYNKVHGIRAIRQILEDSPEASHALLVIDIDGFKAINDTHGHAVGDAVIKDLALRLRSAFRPSDVVCRFGGDEYMVLVRDLPDRLWLEKKLTDLAVCPAPDCTYAISVGVACYPQNGRQFETLFTQADRALYQAKAIRSPFQFVN